ncbi:sphingosine-1-phosphate transporter SPNS2 isoform X5 [Notamacropus eugenii]|uniref:sphingosine-1-phosphate transporter SPNS2 isoform X5 n=1 Tax=Notamacropus eugenii TaxID=9315 RepID=UPI003B67AAF5
MMCLEGGSAAGSGGAAGCADEDAEDAAVAVAVAVAAAAGQDPEQHRRGPGRGWAGVGPGRGGRCGGAGSGHWPHDEVQTLSGSVQRVPPGPGPTVVPAGPDVGAPTASKGPAPGGPQPKPGAQLGRARVAAAAILSVGNVLNYLDRYTVAGVLLDIQQHFGVKDRGAGLLQSVFICSFMVAAPIFGYLGDRFNRKVILSCGIFFWSAVTFSSSFITQQYFWLLVLSRGLVGIGEASYSTIAPTIIGDLFNKNTRTLMLSIFYFAIPLGSGLGYITGSSVKQVAGDWHWALRVSPVMGMITGTLILLFVPAARRGHVEQLGGQLKARTSWLRDMRALIRNRSYVFSSLATSAVSFATGALGMWIPLYLHRAQVVQKTTETCSNQPCETRDRGWSHQMVPPEDAAGGPPRVRGGHAGVSHLHLPHLRGGQDQHPGRLHLHLYRRDTALLQLGHHSRHPDVCGHPHSPSDCSGPPEFHLSPAGRRGQPLSRWLYL